MGSKVKNLREYLKSSNAATLDKLYSHPATCLAIFRDLPDLAKHYILRLLFVEQPIPQAVVTSWVAKQAVSEHEEAIQEVTSLHIWTEAPISGGLPGWLLSGTFRASLKVALLGGGEPWTVKPTSEKSKYSKDVPFLDSYSMERWECILHFMVGSQQNKESPISVDTINTLLHSGLIRFDSGKDTVPNITADGFQFLLMDVSSQVWFFVLQYLDTVESKGMNLVECLTFLFQLSFLTIGKDYSTDGMNESQLSFLQHLREFGLVYQRKRKDGRFYPTRLVINLVSGLKETKHDPKKSGYIVVETNYRVYAYTGSSLQIALLALFTEMQYRFPGFCLGTLTRESVRQALRSGISAEQMISFLTIHAHPEMVKQRPVIPTTVMDQIRLWEIERDRFLFKEGVLYNQFLSQGDFELLRSYANDSGYLIWDNPAKRVMVVSQAGHDDVRRFWKRYKKN